MYFVDLTIRPEYALVGQKSKCSIITVGWLDRQFSYTQGSISKEFLDKLFQYCAKPVYRMKGFHPCSLCASIHPDTAHEYGERVHISDSRGELGPGTAEIRVPYGDKIYASPDMIYHYIVDHGYKPPDEFIEAVMNGHPPGSTEYLAIATKCRWFL